ncbi:MAG: linear amide C-N hydrolase [Bacillota bacterium]|nr:linear amide C-N hydrolase [Bacillota bacterium]
MCTAVCCGGRFFGRNLDEVLSYGEAVVQTPRHFAFPFFETNYAMIGMAHMAEGIPLYYDGMNEKGLAMAGLLFSGSAVYQPLRLGQENVPSWALLPWLLGQCGSIGEAEERLGTLNLTREPFNSQYPPSPLHWMLTDGIRTLVIEPMAEGLRVYENEIGVLTNNPPFPFHRENLRQYLSLGAEQPKNCFAAAFPMTPFSGGAGAVGLPGDWSSASRFVRTAFVKENMQRIEGVTDVFHILAAAAMPAGSIRLDRGTEKTLYTACCDLQEQVYYYKTYENCRITAVRMEAERGLRCYPLRQQADVLREN